MFWNKPFVSEDMRLWIHDCFEWFDARFPPPEELILPTKAFFTAPSGTCSETAEHVLRDVQRLLGYDGDVELMPLDVIPEEYRYAPGALASVAGTFQEEAGQKIIRYDPALMKMPLHFIGVLAHELMHARLAGLEHDVPGGAGAHELATDLGCIIAGFGVFQLQGAEDAGWAGYMSQSSRAYALALFLDARGLGPESALPHLSGRCQKALRKGFKALD